VADLQETLRRLAGRFAARDIMTPLARLEKGKDLPEAQEKLEIHQEYDLIPIHRGGRQVAYLDVDVTLEIEARIPNGTPENVVRTVTENSRTLKSKSQGFEKD
jgi:hypothetical protein